LEDKKYGNLHIISAGETSGFVFMGKDGIFMDGSGLPAGFGFALMANARAFDGYTRMSEAEKERVIMQCKDARSDREVDDIIDRIGLDDEFGDVAEIRDEI
jgi:hypothetical protein